jgi:cyclophilin family peptidyl-prolyl cis-trans isomerase
MLPILAFSLLLSAAQAPQPPQPVPAPARPVVTIETSLGSFTVELFADQAPDSVANFLQYAREGFYDGTIFHRVVSGYVVQGGGFLPDLTEKGTRPPIRNEATNGLSNRRGTVAMARTARVRSATSQFFVNLVDNPKLDHHGYAPDDFGYAVFGRVTTGMDVVDKIGAVPTTVRGDMENVPVTPVLIRHVTVKQ